MAFAGVSDIEARWRPLSTDERSRAGVLLEDASAILESLVRVDEDDEGQADLLKAICCSMVIRAMSATEADSYGATQMSMTAGPYSQSWTYGNPTGDLYLTRLEKKLLGIGVGRIGWVPLGGHCRGRR